MRHLFVILSVFSIILLTNIFLFPENKLKVTGKRNLFFLVTKNSPEEAIRPEGLIYTEKGKVAGRYNLISRSKDSFLCKASRDLSKTENCFVELYPSEIVKTGSAEKKQENSFYKKHNSEKRYRDINGIRFEEKPGGIFLSSEPELLKINPELTFTGIKKYLEKIDQNTIKGYRCNLWSLEDFNRYRKKGHTGDIYLGLVDGRPHMIYWRSGRYSFQMISEDTLPAVCDEIYVLFALKGVDK